jgi:hypothetical protein
MEARMKKPLGAVLVAVCLAVAGTMPAASQTVTRVYTQFDSDKCRHTKGKDVEDYGSWLCAGHDGIAVRMSAGDQRMKVSFGKSAAREPAAHETFPRFNSAYKGTIEWRIETPADGKPRPFATILRWNVKLEDDERDTTGRVLVVTRLGPGGVCHVGCVDARANPNANELAQQLADEKARGFKCSADKPVVAGKVMSGLYMPGRN